jgi:hypothetical protein
MTHRNLSQEEALLVNNPENFLKNNILIPKRPSMSSGSLSKITYFSLQLASDFSGVIEGRKKNRKGKVIPAYDLVEDSVNGGIHAYYLHYIQNNVAPGTLGVADTDPDFFITAALNGCSFSFAQNGPNAGALVAHHNSRQDGNDPATITAQPHAVNATFKHQADYRKIRNGAVDTSYEGCLLGKREAGGVWRFYLQSKKGLAIPDQASTVWRMKGVTRCN